MGHRPHGAFRSRLPQGLRRGTQRDLGTRSQLTWSTAAHSNAQQAGPSRPPLGLDVAIVTLLCTSRVELPYRGSVPIRVLLVEDEPDLSDPMSTALRRAGFEVVVVRSGTAAIAAVGHDGPDVVVLDRG